MFKLETVKIDDLIKDHIELKYEELINDSSVIRDEMNRIEQEYIHQTGERIYDNHKHKMICEKYDKMIKEEQTKI